jgi:hypothetical protein
MRTRHAGRQTRPVIHEHTIYVGDLTRRVESLMSGGRDPSLSRPRVHPPVPLPVQSISSELFEDY